MREPYSSAMQISPQSAGSSSSRPTSQIASMQAGSAGARSRASTSPPCPAGSDRGTHRHRPDVVVRTPQPTRRLFTPTGRAVQVLRHG